MVDKEYNVVVGVDQFGGSTVTYKGVLVEINHTYEGLVYEVRKHFRYYDTLKEALENIDDGLGEVDNG